MSLRGLLIAAILLCVLAGAVYWSQRHESADAAKGTTNTPKLVDLKDDNVQQVQVQRKGDPLTVLERDKSNQWRITAPKPLRVDSDAVSTLVSTFTGLTQDRLVEEKASDLSQFGLLAPAVRVDVSTKDGKKKSLLIGDETPTGGGYFAKLEGDPRVFTIMSGTKSSLDKTWADLRDKRLLNFDDTKVSRIELAAKGQTIELGKSGTDWQILKPQPLRADNIQVDELVRKLKDARMESTPDEDSQKTAAKFAAAPRIAAVNVTDPSGTQTIEVRKSGENYLAKSSVVEGVHTIGKDLGDEVNKGLDDFRNKKLFDFGFTDPSKLEIRDGTKVYGFVKGGEKWWANGKEMDATSVQSLIDKLRDLSAIKFVEGGFTTPLLEITVTSNDGKRLEKVLISKSGDRFLAKRENEAAVYELDGKRVEEIERAAADVKAPPPPAKK